MSGAKCLQNTARVNDPREGVFFALIVNGVHLKSYVTLSRVSAYTRRGLHIPATQRRQ